MVEISAVSSGTAIFHAPSYFETVVIFAHGTTVLQVMEAVLEDFIKLLDISIEHWEAGPRQEDEPTKRLGRPTITDFGALRSEDVTAGYFCGDIQDNFAFAGVQILAQQGREDRLSYGYTDTVTLRVSGGDLSADTTPDRTRRDIDSHHALVRALIARFPVLRAHIYRDANNYAPTPPFADPQHLLYIAHRTDIVQSYDNPDDYWRAWNTVEPLDANRVLVTRALDIDDELEFKAHVYPRTWELVRHARPKLTVYFSPDLYERDKPYYYGPDDVTSPVGYYPPEQWVEFTAFPPEDGHVLPRDIYDFRRWLRQKKMDDGKPLKEIRVTFHKLVVAEREKRPLLDVGCRVFGYNDNGDLVEVTE